MENTKIINRLIDYYLEGSELTQDEHNTVRSLKEEMQAINYTHSCTVENEQLRFLIDKFQTPKGNYLIELLMTEKERKDKKP